MSNKNYRAGARCEYKLVNILRKRGWKAQRFAGSHSDFDVWSMNLEGEEYLFQCKRIEKYNEATVKRLQGEFTKVLNDFKGYHESHAFCDLAIFVKGGKIISQYI